MLIHIGHKTDPADLDRLFTRFFAAVTRKTINYSLFTITPKPLVVSPMIFRELDCPEKCGACCKRYALNYLPDETKRVKEATLEFKVKVNEKEFLLFSDLQQDHTGDWCRNLDVVTGRCMHYEERAFECDLPPLQVNQYKQHNLLTSRGLGRAWALKKIDGTKGALSKMKPLNDISVADTRRKLDRLKQWADYFTLDTWMPEIVAWAMSDPYKIRELRLGF